MQKEINRYIKEIKKQLLYGTKESRQFLKDLRQNVTDFAEENKNADMAQVTEQFGKPEDIAATFFEQYDKKEIKHKVNVRRVVVAAAVTVVTVFVIIMIVAVIDGHLSGNGYSIVYPAEEIELVEGTTAPISTDINSTDTQS